MHYILFFKPFVKMIYKVFEIFRQSTNFFILTSDGPKRVHSSLNDSICKGYIFKDDYINIDKETDTGILFTVVNTDELSKAYNVEAKKIKNNETNNNSDVIKNDENTKNEKKTEVETIEDITIQENFEYNLLDYYYTTHNFLPYLTDVLPYYTNIVTTKSNSTKSKRGIIKYKSRINLANNKAYFFYILNCDDKLIKGMIWKENFKFSYFEIGDEVEIFKYRQSKGFQNHGHIEINEFSELVYFNIDEITISEMTLVKKNNDEKLKNNTSYEEKHIDLLKNINHTVKGVIYYTSMLNKKKGSNYLDYYLLDVENKKVILFYNSDLSFYNIEAGNIIEIKNLRKIQRSGYDLYISTIFTQFKYEIITQLKEECSSFLYEDNKKRKLSINCENEKNDSSLDEEFIKRVKRETNENINKDEEETYVRLNITHSSIQGNKVFIEKGFGFIPDDLDSINDCNEIIDNVSYVVHPFFIPNKISLLELEERCNKLVINESDKFILEATVLGIEEEEDFNIEYVDSDEIKRHYPVKVTVEGNIDFYIFNNFFIPNNLIEDIKTKVDESIGRRHFFIIHAFRDSIDNVLFCISEMKMI